MKKEQKVLIIDKYGLENLRYDDFFFDRRLADTLIDYVEKGWFVKVIKDDPYNKRACVVLEKDKE